MKEEIFTIGDDVSVSEGDHEWVGEIFAFKIIGKEMCAGIMQKGETSPSGDLWRNINQLQKLPTPSQPQNNKEIEKKEKIDAAKREYMDKLYKIIYDK